ncbi:winged helix-turn-helix domain-containing protein [Rhizobium mesosinicum]|uniref:Winged helix-turn-helix domain-containing protein n=1 Tax=Rhizobium mesosinicum TaxID=335017 RepID=A0ABS7GYH3_9HYPH|nr:winged helix-turn-helix domain-containing protein [Rhizobium mesosinicum]MBW9054596.1 winged helix-turn-helix domain-containing protein [Rhizobium mesosinicum]
METPRRKSAILIATDDFSSAAPLVEELGRHDLASTVVAPAQAPAQARSGGRCRILIISASATAEIGLDLCRRIRAASSIPIILLSGAEEQLDGLEAGADYCLPFHTDMRRLMVHVRALLRRSDLYEDERRFTLNFEGWGVDPRRRELVAPDGSHVALLAAEFEILIALCRQPGVILSRRALLDATHIGLGRPLERSVDVHICRLRRKLAQGGNAAELIQTVRLGGYVFVGQINPE